MEKPRGYNARKRTWLAAEGAGVKNLPFERDPVIEAYKRDVDRSVIRENLKRSVEERFLNLMALQRFAVELRRARREAEPQP